MGDSQGRACSVSILPFAVHTNLREAFCCLHVKQCRSTNKKTATAIKLGLTQKWVFFINLVCQNGLSAASEAADGLGSQFGNKKWTLEAISSLAAEASSCLWPGVDWTSDFHMQAQVFTKKVSCQGLFLKEKFAYCCIFKGLLLSSQD